MLTLFCNRVDSFKILDCVSIAESSLHFKLDRSWLVFLRNIETKGIDW